MEIGKAFRLYDLRERREVILDELGEYRHDDYGIRRKGTGYRSSPVENMATDREELEAELKRIDLEIGELERE